MLGPFSAVNVSRVLFALIAIVLFATDANAASAPHFPADANSWVNTGPISLDALKGKGVVLFYFEEDDPKIRNAWPQMLEQAKMFDGKPVIFIAVNSGSPKPKVQQYIQQIKLPWPVMVDTSREFEKASGIFVPIDEKNTSGMRYITPDGEIHTLAKEVLEDAAEKAVEGAAWKVEPTLIPDSMKASWTAVELGNYKGLAPALKKSSSSSKADVKEAAAKLMEVVQKEMDDLFAKTKEAQEAGNTFRAHELVTDLSERFNGFELPKDVATIKKDLSKDAKVKAGVTAAKSVEAARKHITTGSAASKAKTKASLEKIIADFPDTNLALQAQAVLDSAE